MNPQLYTILYGPDSLNHQLFMLINHATDPVLDAVLPVVNALGGSWAVYVYVPLLLLISLMNKELMPRRYIWVYCLATAFGILLEEGLKQYFQVPRPALAIGLDQVRVLGPLKLKNSFPSGHAVFSFMTATVIGYRRPWRWKAPLFSVALLVGYARVYMGAHYPLDVAAGAMVGIFAGLVVWQGYEWVGSRQKEKG